MWSSMRFPIRLKIMIALLFIITAMVSLITFTMARFFHDDKQAYVNDWVSIAARVLPMPPKAMHRTITAHHQYLNTEA